MKSASFVLSAALLALPFAGFAQNDTPAAAWDAGVPSDDLQKLAGTHVSLTVLRMVKTEDVQGLYEFSPDPNFQVAIIEAGKSRAIVLPTATPLSTGKGYALNLRYLGRIRSPARSGLPDPVGVYQEAFYRDVVMARIAMQDELDKVLDKYLQAGYLSRFVVPADRLAEITPSMFSNGLQNPISKTMSHFFVKMESAQFKVFEVAQPTDGNFEVRMVNATTGERAILCLPWNSDASLRRATRGTVVDVGGYVRVLNVTASSVSAGAYYRTEAEFVECLRGQVNAM